MFKSYAGLIFITCYSFECEVMVIVYGFQMNWEKRILKSLNSMCTELSVQLARKVSLTNSISFIIVGTCASADTLHIILK